MDVVSEAASGLAAIRAAEQHSPDVILVEVELPDMSGFDVLSVTRRERKLMGIMVSERPDHAVAAFAAGALDYLLKPLNADRFAESIERARQQCDPAASPNRTPRLLLGERDHRVYPLRADSIDYIESDGNYVIMRSGSSNYTSRDSLKRLSDELQDLGFVRIGRSLLVNIRAVSYVEAAGRGTFKFTLSSGPTVHSSSSYRGSILGVLPLRRVSNRGSPMERAAGRPPA